MRKINKKGKREEQKYYFHCEKNRELKIGN